MLIEAAGNFAAKRYRHLGRTGMDARKLINKFGTCK